MEVIPLLRTEIVPDDVSDILVHPEIRRRTFVESSGIRDAGHPRHKRVAQDAERLPLVRAESSVPHHRRSP
jgi:hypothetical protein